MIYAQRADVKTCAPIELWNTTFRRWVNKGAKGIALIDDSADKPSLRYVFDVSDTNSRFNIPFKLWDMQEKHEEQIAEELANHFGETESEVNPDTASAVAFLKHEYGIGGYSHDYPDGTRGFIDHDAKGLTFKRWKDDRSTVLSWNKVHHRLNELIALDRYLAEKEKTYLPTFEQKEVERAARVTEERYAREALRQAATAIDEKRRDAQYAFSLGDTVQIGAQEYTILGYDDANVMLSNPQYPLLSENMGIEVFERRCVRTRQTTTLLWIKASSLKPKRWRNPLPKRSS